MDFYKFEKGNKALVFDNVCYTLSSLDLGKALNKLSTTDGLGEIGVLINASKVDKRDVAISGYILADNEADMYTRKQYFFNMINPLETFDLIDKTSTKRMTLQATATPKFSTNSYLNSKFLCMFSLDCMAANPCWKDYTDRQNNVALWLGVFHFPLVIPQTEGIITGLREPKLIADIINSGNLPTGMIIQFVATGTVTNPYLLDINSRECLKISKTMSAGEVITINTNYGHKDVIGHIGEADESNYFQYLDLDNCNFLQLAVGTNQFKYDADSNSENLEIKIVYNQNYLGV